MGSPDMDIVGKDAISTERETYVRIKVEYFNRQQDICPKDICEVRAKVTIKW